ncbi:MAG: leucine-rich repeat domain-containing protein [Rikenellaceae bacterium]
MKNILFALVLAFSLFSCSKSTETEPNQDITDFESTLSATLSVDIFDVTNSSAFINSSFTFDEGSDYIEIIRYGVVISQTSTFATNVAQNSLGEVSENTTFAIEITNLDEATTYYIKVYIESQDGDIAFSDVENFATLSTEVNNAKETTFTITTSSITSSSATISVAYEFIGEDVQSFSAYGGGIVIADSENFSSCEVYSNVVLIGNNSPFNLYLSDLDSDATYYYKIILEDYMGNRLFSDTQSFTTLAYVVPQPESSAEVYLSDLSYYTYPDEDLWIIQDAAIEGTSGPDNFSGMKSAISQAKSDGRYVWLEFANLESLPQTTSYNPFYVTSNILSISMPKATFIGAGTFRLSSGLISVSIPSATEIEYGAFMQCASLVDIELNPNYYTLEDGVVYNGDKSTIHTYLYSNSPAEYTAPESVTSVTQSAFYCCEVTSVTLPNVTNINKYAMSTCKGLTTVSMPEVVELESYVFYNCTSLTSISAPKIKIIGKGAFEGCNESCTITLATESEIESIADQTFDGQTADEHPYYKTTLIIGSQNSQWVDLENNYLLDDNGYQHRFKEIILE